MLNLVSLAYVLAEICVFTRIDRQTNTAQSTEQALVKHILTKVDSLSSYSS